MSDTGPCNCDQSLALKKEVARLRRMLKKVDRLLKGGEVVVAMYELADFWKKEKKA